MNTYKAIDYAGPVAFPLWVAMFCYSTVMALLFQKVILPHIPSLYAGHGLMKGDAIYFHHVAQIIADNIHTHGWSWKALWPDMPGVDGNVAILGALYALFGVADPTLIVPINAAFHAFSGVLIFLITQRLWPGQVGKVAGILTAILFVIFPSSLNWYGQVHKDGYAIAGTLLVLYSWLRLLEVKPDARALVHFFVGNLIGIGLIIFVRPYNTYFLALATALWVVVCFMHTWIKSVWQERRVYLLVTSCVCALIAVSAVTLGHRAASSSNVYANWNGNGQASHVQACIDWRWHDSGWVPSPIERNVEKMARTRAGLLCANWDAASNMDRDRMPNDLLGVITYMPRALEVAVLAPFPNHWLDSFSPTRLVGTMEILVWYLLIPGMLLSLRSRLSLGLLLCLVFASSYLAIYGFTIANLGTLHRVRYPFLFMFMAIGMLGWVHLIRGRFFPESNSPLSVTDDESAKASISAALLNTKRIELRDASKYADRKKVASGGLIVSLITMVGFLGFFARDVLMAHKFGLGDQLDAFYIAMLVPMAIVNIFGQSFGATSVSIYLKAEQSGDEVARQTVRDLSMMVTVILIAVSMLLAITAPYWLSLMGRGFSADKLRLSTHLLYGALPLLIFSGMVLLGNAVLSAKMRFTVPAWSQLVVPAFAIVALMIGGKKIGVGAVLAGMVVGQLVNLLLVWAYLKRDGLSVAPNKWGGRISLTKESRQQFLSLIVASIFVQFSLLINNGMASGLGSGSIAALSIGMKVVYFVTGVFGTGISVALLPYFVKFVVNKHLVAARHELSALVSIASVIGMAISLVGYLIFPLIIKYLLIGGKVDAVSLETVVRIIQMGILQVPFFACQLILVKYATALHDNKSILLSAVIGLILNIVFDIALMKWMNVWGIALATSIAVLGSAVVLLFRLHRQGNMSWLDILFAITSWMLFITMMLCIHFESYSGVYATGLALVLSIYVLAKEGKNTTGILQLGARKNIQ